MTDERKSVRQVLDERYGVPGSGGFTKGPVWADFADATLIPRRPQSRLEATAWMREEAARDPEEPPPAG